VGILAKLEPQRPIRAGARSASTAKRHVRSDVQQLSEALEIALTGKVVRAARVMEDSPAPLMLLGDGESRSRDNLEAIRSLPIATPSESKFRSQHCRVDNGGGQHRDAGGMSPG